MSPERVLLTAAVGVLALSMVAVAAVPGALSSPESRAEGPGRLAVREMAISPGAVGGQTAELDVHVRLSHVGPTAENVTVELRAIDATSGLLEDTTTVEVPTIEGNREVPVNGTLTVTRAGGYRVATVVYHDGRRIGAASRHVEGVEALEPAYADSHVDFHRFRATDQPVLEYAIDGTTGSRVHLSVTTYLTNNGDADAGGLRLVVKARQAESGIVAHSAAVPLGRIRPGRTVTPTAELTVPDEYNYYLDAQLWADGVIVGTARSAANLDPMETLSVNETRRSVELEVSEFEEDGAPARERTVVVERTASGGQPGFSAALTILAVVAAVLLAWRHRG